MDGVTWYGGYTGMVFIVITVSLRHLRDYLRHVYAKPGFGKNGPGLATLVI
jgi:hypothetical protein